MRTKLTHETLNGLVRLAAFAEAFAGRDLRERRDVRIAVRWIEELHRRGVELGARGETTGKHSEGARS